MPENHNIYLINAAVNVLFEEMLFCEFKKSCVKKWLQNLEKWITNTCKLAAK